MSELCRFLSDELGRFARRREAIPRALTRVTVRSSFNLRRWRAEFDFSDGPDWNLLLPEELVDRQIHNELLAFAPATRAAAETNLTAYLAGEYSRMYEDQAMVRVVRVERDRVRELYRLDAPAAAIHAAREQLEELARHVREYHYVPPQYLGVDVGTEPSTTTIATSTRSDTLTLDTVREAYQRIGNPTAGEIRRRFGEMRVDLRPGAVNYAYPRGTVFLDPGEGWVDPAAEAKGLELLKRWLSTEQLASYEAQRHFEVRGSASGKRYRINHGRQMNIDELDGKGAKVCGWCFLPQGGLVAGDCMLAQKIALETDEPAALKVANRIGGGVGGAILNRVIWAGVDS